MTLWHPDTCGCQVWMGADGEPENYEVRCNVHQDAPVEDVIARCRAKNLALAQIRARPGGSQADEPAWSFDDQGQVTATHVDFLSARVTRKTVAPLSRADFIAAIAALNGA